MVSISAFTSYSIKLTTTGRHNVIKINSLRIYNENIKNSCTTNGTGTLYLETLNTTSSNLYRTGLLNYQVVKDDVATNLKGNITKSGEIALDIGTLTKASSASTTYKIYVWIDKELVINSDANSKYYGKIRATATQGK